MRSSLAIAAVILTLTGVAHADRHLSLGVGGGLAMHGLPDAKTAEVVGGMIGASLGWERGAPPWRDDGSTEVRAELAPELAVLQLADRGAALGGIRLAVHVSGPCKQGGHARLSLILTPRAGVIEGADGVAAGGDVEIALYRGRSPWRIGMREGFLFWRDRPRLRSAMGDHAELAAFAALAITR